MRQKIKYVWGSVLSVHDLKVGMLPNFYLLFSGRLYKIINLKIFMPIYHYFDTFTTATYLVYYCTNL